MTNLKLARSVSCVHSQAERKVGLLPGAVFVSFAQFRFRVKPKLPHESDAVRFQKVDGRLGSIVGIYWIIYPFYIFFFFQVFEPSAGASFVCVK